MVCTYKIGEHGERPWGSWKVDEIGNGYIKKTITVSVGGCLSLQSHKYRSEKWEIVLGKAEVTIDNNISVFHAGSVLEIPVGVVHRLKNVGDEVLIVKETQFGDVLDEDDIIRYEDLYGRISRKEK